MAVVHEKLEVNIRKATLEDIPNVYEIEKACFPTPWPFSAFVHEVDKPHSHFLVAETEKKEIAGFMIFWDVIDEIHLLNIAVHPDFRRLGIATGFMRHMLAHGYSIGATLVFLEVRKSNIPAIKLYSRFGFNVIGVRKNYYPEIKEDALVMLLALT